MAVLGRLLMNSAERLDLPDFLSIDSYTQGDFKYLMRSIVGASKPYILTGFDVIDPGAAIGTQSLSIRVADSVVYYPTSGAGPFSMVWKKVILWLHHLSQNLEKTLQIMYI